MSDTILSIMMLAAIALLLGAIAAWRREQQVERTKAIRPDLLPE